MADGDAKGEYLAATLEIAAAEERTNAETDLPFNEDAVTLETADRAEDKRLVLLAEPEAVEAELTVKTALFLLVAETLRVDVTVHDADIFIAGCAMD